MRYKHFFLESAFVFFIISVATCKMEAQDTHDKPFKYIRVVKENNHARSKIEFYDSLTNQLIKTIDAIKINPFGGFREKVVQLRERYGTPIYELDTTKLIWSIDSIELVSKTNHYANNDLTPFLLFSRYLISNQGRNYVAILYELTTLNKSGHNISSHSTILIFDRNGKLVKQTPLWDVNGGRPVISDDGRFVLFQSGGPYEGDDGGSEAYLRDALRVYDTQTNLLYVDDDVDMEKGADLIDGKYFNKAIFHGDRTRDVIVYDFYNKIKYKRKFSFEEMSFYHSASFQGFLFTKPSGDIYLKYSLENDFLKSKIVFEK